MAKKKKFTKTERREQRLRKARQWVLTYEGSHIVRAYRKHFKVDPICAIRDLEEIGAISPEKLANLKAAESARLEQKRKERERKQRQELFDRFPDSDNTFMYIAGYTSGGVPYGTTWAEMGLNPYEIPEDYDFYGGADVMPEPEHLLSSEQVELLFDYLTEQLDKHGCDNSLKFTVEWLNDQGFKPASADSVIEEIKKMGGYCDCEVIYNCYEDYDLA